MLTLVSIKISSQHDSYNMSADSRLLYSDSQLRYSTASWPDRFHNHLTATLIPLMVPGNLLSQLESWAQIYIQIMTVISTWDPNGISEMCNCYEQARASTSVLVAFPQLLHRAVPLMRRAFSLVVGTSAASTGLFPRSVSRVAPPAVQGVAHRYQAGRCQLRNRNLYAAIESAD